MSPSLKNGGLHFEKKKMNLLSEPYILSYSDDQGQFWKAKNLRTRVRVRARRKNKGRYLKPAELLVMTVSPLWYNLTTTVGGVVVEVIALNNANWSEKGT